MTPPAGDGEGATGARPGPLAGVRVVELAGIGPAPFAAMLLADLGADVIRVDRPGEPSLPVPLPPESDLLRRGRPSVALDLKHPDGLATTLDLVEQADVLLEGYRPGVAERLGLGPDDCLARNPRLVYGRMTGWGQDGPLAHSAGHDIGYVAVTGALHAIGRAGGPPQVPVNLVGDFGGGALYLVVGVLAALLEARTSGRGQVVDAAIVDGTAHLSSLVVGLASAGLWSDRRGTNLLDTGAPFYDVYETSDGGWLAVGPLEPAFYAELLHLLDLTDAAPDRLDPAQWPALRTLLADAFRTRTRDAWTAVFEGTDACVEPVLSYAEAPAHPHLAARGTYVEHHGIVQPAPAPRFSRTPAVLGAPPSTPGADTRAALAAWGVDDVDALIASGAAFAP
ncbi:MULTISPECIES: CaiB/BaiF CoA-transferase family protein [unclassified Terrabacter]|uniref:CaiB/BaiF CoA transferase family protein n=1 Tax=unclassified Terrabacter TaxID=2630222 RepID=UPI0006FC3A38|nr:MULTISPECIES: CaiB/BaiF CoA-transferase family protein [unclassified Terrabacter]KRB47496.1 carnitine dehydratase [Terrabacter sp. Root181]KRF35599.1 carnitine dehydratase [Terrabacter sp. Soil810]